MKAALDSEHGNWAMKRYLRADGSEVSKTLGGCAERLDAGKSSVSVRETASSVYHVIEGSGSSMIGEEKLAWKKGDIFCVPTWYKYQHSAGEGETVYLYRFDDKPMLQALGFYRTEETDIEGLVAPH